MALQVRRIAGGVCADSLRHRLPVAAAGEPGARLKRTGSKRFSEDMLGFGHEGAPAGVVGVRFPGRMVYAGVAGRKAPWAQAQVTDSSELLLRCLGAMLRKKGLES